MDPAYRSPAELFPMEWRPPSSSLILRDGIWQSRAISQVSYPTQGNENCYQVEDGSYWFRHRMNCLHEIIACFPPAGMFWDIGGGNGFVAANLQARGIATVLLEPGDGVFNARQRGVRHIVHATLGDAGFAPHSLPAVGAFDVIEHIGDETGFLGQIRESLIPGGRFYCTVPALPVLWSEDDVHAGHFRRYTRRSICTTLARAGFTVEFVTYLFAWLTLPVLAFRALPTRLYLRNKTVIGSAAAIRAEHRLPRLLAGLVDHTQAWELDRLGAKRPLPFGTSLLCVARANIS